MTDTEKRYTWAEVQQHNTDDDTWIVIENKVYDVTKFLKMHPGGRKVLAGFGGKDASEQFWYFHTKKIAKRYFPKFYVGDIADPVPEKKEKRDVFKLPMSKRAFGEQIPGGDPNWYQDFRSPYYNEGHRNLRKACREFIEEHIMPNVASWDEMKKIPKRVFKLFGEKGFMPGLVGGGWQTKYASKQQNNALAELGIKPEEWDYFHEGIMADEMGRCGSGGLAWGVSGGLAIGLPPIIHFGSDYLKDKVVPACLSGEKFICLAITEPWAGSDVANLKTSAEKTADGKHYLVNGVKKWITNGVFADYFTVAVRTGKKGMNGISLLLVERTMGGVKTKQMKCSGVWSSGTTYITLEDVMVPVENLIGAENEGFKCIMKNFNHERWSLCVVANRFSRVCYEDSIKFAHKRKTFGKRLIDHPVIRNKLAHMSRQIEATQAWIENITYQMCNMSMFEAMIRLGGMTALLKAQCTRTFDYCASEAVQIFGGLGYTRGGQGERVERLYREVKAWSIPGGSEEIMLDLGLRQGLRTSNYNPKKARL